MKGGKYYVKCKADANVNMKYHTVCRIQVARKKEMAYIVLTFVGKKECTLQNLSEKG
jgi:hypothetical protein